jgi:hypothetical protein
MLSIIVTTIFTGMIIGMISIQFYQYKFLKQLEKNSGLKITRRNPVAAKRDLKEILNSNVDSSLKIISRKLLDLIKVSNWLFFGSLGLLILIFVFNGIFKHLS